MTYPGEVDWSDLVHAYGTATDTPGHLAALTSLDPSAFDHLWGAVLHQGTIYPPRRRRSPGSSTTSTPPS